MIWMVHSNNNLQYQCDDRGNFGPIVADGEFEVEELMAVVYLLDSEKFPSLVHVSNMIVYQKMVVVRKLNH